MRVCGNRLRGGGLARSGVVSVILKNDRGENDDGKWKT